MAGRITAMALALVALPFGAQAQDTAVSVMAAPVAAAPVPAPIDPARLAKARQTVDFVFPAGTYGRIMGRSMQAMLGPALHGVGAIPMRDIAAMGGMKEEDVARLGKGTLAEMMTILDPAYRRRMELTSKVMADELTGLMTEIEPGMRVGLAQAYARRFDVRQLDDLNRFFATPTGRAYAADSMVIYTDPEVVSEMTKMMPTLMKRMPAMMAKVQQASSGLPKPKTFDQLTPAERTRLMDMLGKSAPAASKDAPKT